MILPRVFATLILCGVCAMPQTPPTFTTIYNFTCTSYGGYPSTALVVGDGGVLYGVTPGGGTYGNGTVFSLTPPSSSGGAWTGTVLYSFAGGSDGALPEASPVIGAEGVLYGTTFAGGGSFNYGTVYSLTPPASSGGGWTEQILYGFSANGRGVLPGGLTIAATGEVYGVTEWGGASKAGTVFALTPPASPGQAWSIGVVTSFGSGLDAHPSGGVVIGQGSVLFGTSPNGGSAAEGSAYSITPPISPGGPWTEETLHEFGGTDNGQQLLNGVVIGAGGVLYGTAYRGGTFDSGMAFSLTPPSSPGGTWTETPLYNFPSGALPGPVIVGGGNLLYGVTYGSNDIDGIVDGTAYVLKPPATPGGNWQHLVLHTFTGSDGTNPNGLTFGGGNTLCGTTAFGGTYGCGTAFVISQ